MLELMARGGMRIGEVLKIRPIDIQDRKITLPDPKSGKESELVFIPQKVADRLKEYIKNKGIEPYQRNISCLWMCYANVKKFSFLVLQHNSRYPSFSQSVGCAYRIYSFPKNN